MRQRARALLLAAALGGAAAASPAFAAPGSGAAPAPAAQRALTARDLVMLDRVSDPHISPDGRWVVYDVRSTDWDANKGRHALWLLDLGRPGATPTRMPASEGGATNPRWAPDSRTIYFLSSRSGSDQVWRTTIAAGSEVSAVRDEARVTDLPLDVGSFRVSPDGRRLVVSMAVFPDCDTPACSKARAEARKAAKTSGVIYDRLFVRHWDQWADGARNALFAVDLPATGLAATAVPLMRGFDGDAPSAPFGDDQDYAITPDGGSVIFSARLAGRTEPWSTNFDLWRVPIDGSAAPRNLTPDNPAWDAQPKLSPDGTKLAYLAMKRPGFEADRFGVMVMDLRTGSKREIAPTWDRSAEHLEWTADGTALYATAQDVGQRRLYLINVASRDLRPITPVTGAGHTGDFSTTRGALVYTHDDLTRPADLFRVVPIGSNGEQLTHYNAERLAGLPMGEPEQFSFPGWNGETVHGYVVKPAGFQPGRKYPVAFLIHGGPQGSFGNLFHYRWNAQTYAGAGFAVVMIDFHGSTGYGQAFTDAISRHWGDRPLEDLQKGWAYALAKYSYLDGGRACALGGSYGGFMVNWIAGNWSAPWRCLVNHDGLFDTRAMGYSTEELWFSEWENGGTAFGAPAGYERFNPVNHVAAWTKPELVIHGAKDFRVPLEQGLGTFTALQRKGVESRFLYFPDENHWVLKPQNSVQWHATVEDWLRHWTAER